MGGCAICNIYYFADDGGGYTQPSSPEGSLAPMPSGVWDPNGGGGSGTVSADGRYLFGQGSPYPIAPWAPQFKGPSLYDRLRDYFVDGFSDVLSDAYANVTIGVSDLYGADHPGHATVVGDVRPGIRSGVAVGFDIVVQLALAAILGLEARIVAMEEAAVAKNVVVPSSRYPQTAAHIRDAQAAGHPSVLTIERAGADANRAAAQAGKLRVPGTQLDEYPPAMFREGGTGASTRPVNPGDNMGAGACIGNQCRGLEDGTRVRIVVE